MHKYILVRGNLNHVKKWENDMCAQHLPFQMKNKEGKEENFLAEINLRPINLYEIIFPEDCEKQLMGVLKPIKVGNPHVKRIVGWFSKLLKLEPSKVEWKPYVIPVNRGVWIVDLGNKKDEMNWKPKEESDVFKLGYTPKESL